MALAETVKLCVRFLDNIIDACHYPVDEIAQMSHANRKIGLGIMGFADCLFMLGIPYDSKAAIDIGRKIMKFVNEHAQQASGELAKASRAFPELADKYLGDAEKNERCETPRSPALRRPAR